MSGNNLSSKFTPWHLGPNVLSVSLDHHLRFSRLCCTSCTALSGLRCTFTFTHAQRTCFNTEWCCAAALELGFHWVLGQRATWRSWCKSEDSGAELYSGSQSLISEQNKPILLWCLSTPLNKGIVEPSACNTYMKDIQYCLKFYSSIPTPALGDFLGYQGLEETPRSLGYCILVNSFSSSLAFKLLNHQMLLWQPLT